jgi:ACS family tartrate transporter-like MFS transporter
MAVIPLPALASAGQIADRTRHSVALRLLPFLFVLYIVNFLDRTSVAYAAIGMSRDLGFSDQVFGLAMAIFFPSYLAFQIPGALLVERWSARRVISATMIAWGALTSLTALIHTPGQLYAARIILGAAESAFFPGVIVYLSHWFIREDRAKAIGNFMAAIPLSFVIGSPIAGWVLGHFWFGISGWRWLFVLEGMPAIVFGVAAFFLLPDWPREAVWLDDEQKQWIEHKLRDEKELDASKMSIGRALRSRAIVLLAIAGFLNNFLIYCFAFWFPTMLKRLSGLSDVRVGLLGALPYLAAFLALQLNGWHSDRHRERRWHSALPLFIAAVGLVALVSGAHSLTVAMLFFVIVGLDLAFFAPFWSIPTETLSDSAAAAAVGLMASVVNFAGFVGPYLFGYLHSRTGTFSYGLAGMAVAGLASAILILAIPAGHRQSQPEGVSAGAADTALRPVRSPDPAEEVS